MDNLDTFESFRFNGPNDSLVLAGFDNRKVNYWAINYFPLYETHLLKISLSLSMLCWLQVSYRDLLAPLSITLRPFCFPALPWA